MTGFTLREDTAEGKYSDTGLKKCSASYDGGVSFTSGSQCAQRLSADRGCFLYGGNSSEAWGSDLVGRP